MTWTGLTSFITKDAANAFKLNIYSQDIANGGATAGAPTKTFAMTFKSDITLAGGNGPSGTTVFNAASTNTFNIVITNPCYTATIPSLTFSPNAVLAVVDGATAT